MPDSKNMEKKLDRELWYRWRKAAKEGNEKERKRLHTEVAEAIKGDTANAMQNMRQLLTKATDMAQVAEKQPNLAKCVLSTMGELEDIGYWDGKKNSTYNRASETLDDFVKLERKRVEYLTAQTAYKVARFFYTEVVETLAENLILKFLAPFQGTAKDPMKWYMSSSELIKVCKHKTFRYEDPDKNGEVVKVNIHITIPTLRKYQALNLIPKSVRLGRKGYYSLLTVLRLLLINILKDKGYPLRAMRDSIGKCLKDTLENYCDKYPGDRTEFEQACVSMTLTTDEGAEYLFLKTEGDIKKKLHKKRGVD